MNKTNDPVICKINFDNKDVFEIGSGFGGFSREHFLRAKSFYGIDTSHEAVEHLRKNWPISQEIQESCFEVGSIVDLSLEGKEFDCVVFSNSF